MLLTDLTLKNLKPPATGSKTYFDEQLTGFGVRVSYKGTATYIVVYGAKRRRVKIGRVGVIKLKDARQKAKDLLAQKTLAKDEPETVPFKEGLDIFLAQHCAQRNKPSTAAETERLLKRHFLPTLERKRLTDIKTADLMRIVDGLSKTPAEANHAFTAARTFFRWAVRRRYLAHSPSEGLELPSKRPSRARVLSDTELGAILRTARGKGQFGQILQLLILTLQREGQIANLRAEWLDREKRLVHFPGEIMKSGRPHTIPYGDMAAAIFEALPKAGFLFLNSKGNTFNSWGTAKANFDKDLKLPHWTLHDLRRTGSTMWAALKIPPHITEKMLDHSTGTISVVAA